MEIQDKIRNSTRFNHSNTIENQDGTTDEKTGAAVDDSYILDEGIMIESANITPKPETAGQSINTTRNVFHTFGNRAFSFMQDPASKDAMNKAKVHAEQVNKIIQNCDTITYRSQTTHAQTINTAWSPRRQEKDRYL